MIPTWFRPWMAWAGAVAALAVLLGFQTMRLSDAQADLAKEQAAHAQTVRDHALALAKAETAARQTEAILRDDMDKLAASAAKEKEDAKAREDALVERVRTGERRLSVRVASCVPASSSPASHPGAASEPGADGAVAELDPEVAGRVLRITGDGDQAIRERNACFAAYERARALINGAAAGP